MGLFQYFCHGFFLFHLITFAPLIPCQFPNCFSLALLWCSPQALQEAAVSYESPETQEEREKAWRRDGRQPEKLGFGLFGFFRVFFLLIQFQISCLTMVGELFQMFHLTMVGELAAPLPGTARGLTVQPSQGKLLERQEIAFISNLFFGHKHLTYALN